MANKLSTSKSRDQTRKKKNDKIQRRMIWPRLLTRIRRILTTLALSRNSPDTVDPAMQTGDKTSIRPRKPYNINWNELHVKDTASRGTTKIGLTNKYDNEKSNTWIQSVYNTTDHYNYNKFNPYHQHIDENEMRIKHGTSEKLHARTKKLSEGPAKPVTEYCSGHYMRQSLGEYLVSSTLHGLRYVGDGNLSWFERVFWLMAFTMALLCAAYFIQNVYRKWSDEPMIVSLNPDPLTLTTIPFPAITVCNANRARRSVAERILKNGTSVDRKLLESVCNMNNDTATLDLDASQQQADWNHVKQFLITVTQPCSEMIPVCMWKSEMRVCENLFNTQLTDDGLCCTFNAVHKDKMFRNPRDISDLNITFPFPAVDWTPENGYPEDAPTNGFPWRPIGPGANLGLTLVLDANIPEYYCSSINSAAFKILLHSPVETPKIAQYGDLIHTGLEFRIEVAPRVYDASPNLETISLKKRNCLFADELQLVYYRTYTQKNCVLECEARLTLEKCNCTQNYMPKNRTIKICGTKDSECVEQLKNALDDKLHVSSNVEQADCDSCLPACTELTYTRDMSSGSLKGTYHINYDLLAGKSREYFRTNMAVLHFYFVDTSFMRFTKGEIFGFTEFLSNTGGLLGLFMGFSFMSIIEILYFLSLRMLCGLQRQRHTAVTTAEVYPYHN